jgi:hypothetical protein
MGSETTATIVVVADADICKTRDYHSFEQDFMDKSGIWKCSDCGMQVDKEGMRRMESGDGGGDTANPAAALTDEQIDRMTLLMVDVKAKGVLPKALLALRKAVPDYHNMASIKTQEQYRTFCDVMEKL